MRTALISDIHGNLEALQTVLADIDRRKADRIVCLGDMIGYGPNPRECIDLVMERCEYCILGNHDFAALYEPTNFNVAAEQASFWTRRQFEFEPDEVKRKKRLDFLGKLAVRRWEGDVLYVHASPRKPINEYIFPDDVHHATNKMKSIFDCIETRCFVGHTHMQGIFTDEPDFYPPAELGNTYSWKQGKKVIINPGSVGQPRDRDPRAAYAIADDEKVEFVRIEYDVHTTARKIKGIPELNNFLGLRLMDGR